MNLIKRYIKIVLTIYVFGIALSVQSCADKGKEILTEDQGSHPKLIVSVAGILNEFENSAVAYSKKAGMYRNNNQTEDNLVNVGDFTAEISVNEQSIEKLDGPGSLIRSSSGRPKSAAIAMGQDYKYRLVLYTKDGKFASSTLLNAGATTAIDVETGEEYSWFAYSYNSTDPVPELDNQDNPTLPTALDKDMLYANGTGLIIGTQAGQNVNLPITFKHLVSKITVAVDVRGLDATATTTNPAPAKINNLSAVFGNPVEFPQSVVNLKTGQMGTSSSNTIDTGTEINFHESEEYGAAVQEAYYYTAKNDGGNIPLQVTINTLSLSYDNKTENLTGLKATFANIHPAPGKDILAGLKLFKGTAVIADITWAPGNLYYDANSTDKYKFRPNDIERFGNFDSRETDYWPFKSSTPMDFNTNTVDPCTKVIPLNSWRMPTNAEINALINANPPVQGDQYVEYTAADGKKVRFNMDGYLSVFLPAASHVMFNYGSVGEFWTSESNMKDGYLYGNSFKFDWTTNYLPKLNDGLASGTNMNKMIIRCVREKN